MHILYAYFKAENPHHDKFEKELQFSIQKTYELYHFILLLIIDLSRFAEQKMEQAKVRQMPSLEDLKPNTRFIDNKVINQISNNQDFRAYLNAKKLSWVNYPEIIRKIFLSIKDSEEYERYMNSPESNYKQDKEFVLLIFEKYIAQCEDLYQCLEEISIYWNDDVEFVISMIIRTLQKFKESQGDSAELLPLFKNDEDREFSKLLFRKVIANYSENLKIIDSFTENWEIERIAFIDVLIMQMAITEMVEFPSIPTKVSLNEYIDIVKFYSTTKSGTFVNGVLDKIITHLKNEKKIVKRGKGLMGEI
jgi:transcription antitermination protein NusB